MSINDMTIEQFKNLPIIKEKITDFNSIVLLPTNVEHDSGYNYYHVIPCLNEKPIGKVSMYDTFRIFEDFDCGIDCLRNSMLMRIFFKEGKYVLIPYMHMMEVKEKYNVKD